MHLATEKCFCFIIIIFIMPLVCGQERRYYFTFLLLEMQPILDNYNDKDN
jgi:hypothetical protein